MTDTTMNTGAASLSDEQIEALKAAALAATPQDIDGAQRVDRYEDGSHILCPACGGEGYVELNADFCNYDGEALGVQFYGIGNAHVLAEAYFRAAKPATMLALIERLERAEATPTPQADAAPVIGQHDLSTSEGGRAYIAEFFATRLRRHDFQRYIEERLAADFACALAGYLSEHVAAIAAGGAQEPVAMSADECSQDVYEHGKSIGLFDIPKETANAICAGISAATGARVDWHYIAGRVHMKALPRVAATVPTAAARDVLAERQRQVTAEGWTPEHDDGHAAGDIAIAAACYAANSGGVPWSGETPSFWPWCNDWWKPTTPRRDLVKAGALILAEIERIDRAAPAAANGEQEVGS